MQAETWAAWIDWNPAVYEALWDAEHDQPRDLWALVYDADDALRYPPLQLFSVAGDEDGLLIGGVGSLHALGSGGIGPTEPDIEYLSGANKLGNPVFALDPPDLYWQRLAEGSLWEIADGVATNPGGSDQDDVLASDELFPCRPGDPHRATALGVSGTGRMRVRVIYSGKFNPPNLLVNGDMEDGGAGWSVGSFIAFIVDPASDPPNNIMRVSPIPKPDLADDPGFESGAGYALTAGTAGDMALVNDGAKAFTGSWSMRAGPNFQPQIIQNSGFETGTLAHWVSLAGTWGPTNMGAGVAHGGTWAADIGGTTPQSFKQLVSNANASGPVVAYSLTTGRRYRFEGKINPGAGVDGRARIVISLGQTIAGPTNVTRRLVDLGGSESLVIQGTNWNRYATELDVPDDVNWFFANLVSEEQSAGNYYFDDITCHLISGNFATMTSTQDIPVVGGTTYELGARINDHGLVTGGVVRVGVLLQGPGMEPLTEEEEQAKTLGVWTKVTKTVRVPEGYTTATRYVTTEDVTGAGYHVDQFTFIQQDNNRTSTTADNISVTPERTYKVRATGRSGAALTRGNVRLSVVCSGAYRPSRTFESSPQDSTNGAQVDVSVDVTPPSGLDVMTVSMIATDIDGDFFDLDDFTVTDNDTGTVVFDAVAVSPGGTSPFVDAVAPDGATDVRCAVVVEAGSTSWTLGGGSLVRTTLDPATGADIIADILTDPTTGAPLAIGAGTITAPDPIPYDVRFIRTDRRTQLDHLCAVVNDPVLEYRLNPVHPPTIDAGPPDVVFTTHPLAYAIRPRDHEVDELSNPQTDTSERPTEITVVGNDRQTASGRAIPITATAQVPGPVRRDLNNRPVVRTKTVTASTVDHFEYARAYAADLAEREANPPLLVTVKLSGRTARADVPPGDTVPIYHPEAGLTARPANPTTIEGQPAWPRLIRVQERERVLGPSYRIEMLSPDGSTFDLAGLTKIRWSAEDAVQLTVGVRLPEWKVDPQGGAEGRDFLRWLASRPR